MRRTVAFVWDYMRLKPFLRSLLNGGNLRNATSRFVTPCGQVLLTKFAQRREPPQRNFALWDSMRTSPSYEVCSTEGTSATQLRALGLLTSNLPLRMQIIDKIKLRHQPEF